MDTPTNPSNHTPTATPTSTSLAISEEISRFESVHPAIYAIYELIESLGDLKLANEIREHVVSIEDSFVNSQEWTLSTTSTPMLHIGLLGNTASPKSTLVHRYLTGQYLPDNSPEGGRFKKQVVMGGGPPGNQGKPHLLLIRDEGGPPTLQFANWIDVLVFVAGSSNGGNHGDDLKTCFSYASRFNSYRLLRTDVPVVLVLDGNGSTTTNQDGVVAMEFKKIPHNAFFQTDVQNGVNVERVFSEACLLAVGNKYGDVPPVVTAATPTPSSRKLINRRKSNLFQRIENNRKNNHQQVTMETVATVAGHGRTIPIKQGTLLKKSYKLKKWKKKFIVLTTNTIGYYDNINSYMNSNSSSSSSGGKTIQLCHANVKVVGEKCFTMTTLENKVLEFEAGNGVERDEWVGLIERGIYESLGQGQLGGGVGGQGGGPGGVFGGGEITISDWDRIVAINPECADCGGVADVNWLVINWGVVVCRGCSGCHRNLGCHVSRVRSGVLDRVSPPHLALPLLLHGNAEANRRIYEANLPPSCQPQQPPQKPHPQSTPSEKSTFIRRKYADLEFTPFPVVSKETLLTAIKNGDFLPFFLGLLRAEKYCLYVWGEELLGEVVRRSINKEGEGGAISGAWVQVLLWGLGEELREEEKERIKRGVLLGGGVGGGVLAEEVRGVLEAW